ncbi:acetyl transferase [Knoellia flava TL1]|uniref:Acetyltransferase n=2 Tax=Knoellia flava TaxID=913969 RepID=A0A8H9KSX1_9MICO|nr:NeuD/PglB/VioB family sugar acetyltransferase [Knoellia flava]KGN34004.1 acetyl transferase [Knoellia flava TL1]GGB83723.1 acetyltransferase [Knoellia flava]
MGAGTTTEIVVVGGGGFGREVVAMIQELSARGAGVTVTGVVDDSPSRENRERLYRLGVPLLGPIDRVSSLGTELNIVVGVGSACSRRQLVAKLTDLVPGVRFPALIHPTAWVGPDVTLEEGAIICAGARLSTQITVGRHVQIDQNATIGHDVTLGDYARVNPQGCVSGAVNIGSGATVGASATVLQGLSIGSDSIVGAGSVVTHDIGPGVSAYGVPARVHQLAV